MPRPAQTGALPLTCRPGRADHRACPLRYLEASCSMYPHHIPPWLWYWQLQLWQHRSQAHPTAPGSTSQRTQQRTHYKRHHLAPCACSGASLSSSSRLMWQQRWTIPAAAAAGPVGLITQATPAGARLGTHQQMPSPLHTSSSQVRKEAGQISNCSTPVLREPNPSPLAAQPSSVCVVWLRAAWPPLVLLCSNPHPAGAANLCNHPPSPCLPLL